MKIPEGILPGALVKCINDDGYRYPGGIKRGELYTVFATGLHGAAVYVHGVSGAFTTSRFQLIYNDRENFNEPDYYVGLWH